MTRIAPLSLVVMVAAAIAWASFAGPRPAQASSRMLTTTLQPGLNLVGWLGPPAAVSDVFADLPQLATVRADINGIRRLAHREIAERAERLEVLDTGQGYWFFVEGERPIRWTRSALADADRLELEPGSQLISWSGRDGVTLDAALRGLSDYINSAWSWDAEHRRWHSWPPAHGGFTDLLPVLNRGDAFGVMLRRPLVWRQPSGELPEIEFLGDVPEDVRAMVRDDLRFVVRLFTERFGVEADPSRLKLTVPLRPQDLFGPSVTEWPPAITLASIPHDPSEPVTILMPAFEWAPRSIDPTLDPMSAGRDVLVHEYFHALQSHLAGPGFADAPNWLAEGGPTWLMEQLSNGPGRSQAYLLEAAQLELSERRSDQTRPDHGLGYAVTRMMVERFGAQSYFNLWRGMQARGGVRLDWREALERVVGMPERAFYEAYEEWIRGTYPWLEVELQLPDGLTPEDVSVYAIGEAGLRQVGSVGAEVRRVALAAGVDYQFALSRHAEGCSAYRQRDGGLGGWQDSAAIRLSPSQPNRIAIAVPDEFCTLRLRGRVEHLDGSGRGDGLLSACAGPDLCEDWQVEADGRFDVAVPLPGEYVLSYQDAPGGCPVYYSETGLVSRAELATPLDLSEGGTEAIVLRPADPLCGMSVRGRLLNLPATHPQLTMNGMADNQLQLWLFGASGSPGIEATISDDGRFQASVASPGDYDLRITPMFTPGGSGAPIEDCGLWYQGEITVRDGEHVEMEWELPTDFCRWRVSGTVVTPTPEAVSDMYLQMCRFDPSTGRRSCDNAVSPNPDGSFAMFVPYHGEFYLKPSWEPHCHEADDPDFRVHLVMDGADITDVTMTLPDNPCARR